MAHHFILLRLNPFDLGVDREGWQKCKHPYLGVLGSYFEKLLSYLKSTLSNLFSFKVWCEKNNQLDLRRNVSDLFILGLEFGNNTVISEVNILELV